MCGQAAYSLILWGTNGSTQMGLYSTRLASVSPACSNQCCSDPVCRRDDYLSRVRDSVQRHIQNKNMRISWLILSLCRMAYVKSLGSPIRCKMSSMANKRALTSHCLSCNLNEGLAIRRLVMPPPDVLKRDKLLLRLYRMFASGKPTTVPTLCYYKCIVGPL